MAADVGVHVGQQCISSGAMTADAQQASQAGQSALAASGNQVATPTVLDGGTKIDTNRSWLSDLTRQ